MHIYHTPLILDINNDSFYLITNYKSYCFKFVYFKVLNRMIISIAIKTFPEKYPFRKILKKNYVGNSNIEYFMTLQ